MGGGLVRDRLGFRSSWGLAMDGRDAVLRDGGVAGLVVVFGQVLFCSCYDTAVMYTSDD